MLLNEESYLVKTIIDAIAQLGGDTKEIKKALSIVRDFNKLDKVDQDEIHEKLPKDK